MTLTSCFVHRDASGKTTGPSELFELVEINRIKVTLQPHSPTRRRRAKVLLSGLIMLVAVATCGTMQYLVLELTLNYGDEVSLFLFTYGQLD